MTRNRQITTQHLTSYSPPPLTPLLLHSAVFFKKRNPLLLCIFDRNLELAAVLRFLIFPTMPVQNKISQSHKAASLIQSQSKIRFDRTSKLPHIASPPNFLSAGALPGPALKRTVSSGMSFSTLARLILPDPSFGLSWWCNLETTEYQGQASTIYQGDSI